MAFRALKFRDRDELLTQSREEKPRLAAIVCSAEVRSFVIHSHCLI
jgi:hypothetical protein